MAYDAIKQNMARMLREGASPEEVELYVASKGISPGDLQGSKHTLERAGYQTLGGMAGGAIASPGGITTPVGIGLGSAIGGQAYDLKEEILGRKVRESLPERTRGAVEDFTLDVVSPIALSKGIYGIKKAAGATVGKARGLFKPAKYDVYKKFGVKPTAAMATRSKGLGAAEHALGDFPITADIMQSRAQYNIQQMTVANKVLAKEYGPILNREEIGTLLKKGVPGVLDRYDKVYKKLFDFVAKDMGDQPQSISNTFEMLKTLVKESKTGPDSGIGKLAKEIVGKAKPLGGGLPWASLKSYRTKMGELLKSPELVSTRNMRSGELKRLYGAMTKDLDQAALKAGEKVHARWRATNKYFEIKLNRDIPILEEIVKKRYPEEVFDAVMRSSQKGGSRLRLLKKQLSRKEWEATVGTVLGKMGDQLPSQSTTGGGLFTERVFSPSTFMTNWGKLSGSAKRALFKGGRYDGLAKELNEFVRVAGDMKAVEQLANKSKTGSVLMFYGMFQSTAGATGAVVGGTGGLATGVGVGTMTVGVPRLTARLLTNEKFVRWINKGFKIAKTKPNDMSVHLGRLMALRFKEDIQEDVDNVIKSFLEG